MKPEDWNCRECGKPTLYPKDHDITCSHYPHRTERGRNN